MRKAGARVKGQGSWGTNKIAVCVIAAAALLGGCCGTRALHEPAAPASHHAQRKYDEAIRKGAIVPAEKKKEDRK